MTRRTTAAAAAGAILLATTSCANPTTRTQDPPPLNADACAVSAYAAEQVFAETKDRCAAEGRPESTCAREANAERRRWAAKNYPDDCPDRAAYRTPR